MDKINAAHDWVVERVKSHPARATIVIYALIVACILFALI